MAIFLRHEGCPRCGSSDALAVYDDGGTFCFSCGIPSGASVPSFREETNEYDEDSIVLPHDLSRDFPQEVVEWIHPTGIKIEELIAHGYFFSKSASKLVRTFYSDVHQSSYPGLRGRCIAAEDRFLYRKLSQSSPKSKFHGSKSEIKAFSYRGQPYNPLQPSSATGGLPSSAGKGQEAYGELCNSQPRSAVLVEDSLSSIKIGRFLPSAPLFGSSVSKDKLASLVKPFDEVFVWLDSDKLNNARQIADQIKMLGKKSRVVFTELDPKYLDAQEIL